MRPKPSEDQRPSEGSAFGHLSPEQQLAHLNALVACSHDAIFTTDLSGTILSWNPASERIYGYTAEEMIGSSITKVLPPERRDELREIIQAIVTGSTPESFETRRIRKDGVAIDVYVTVSPVRSASGQLLGVSTIARDITGRKSAEAALAQKQRELQDYFENAVIGLHWVGGDGTILWANKAEMDLLGYQAQEYIGHHIAEFHADAQTIDDILCRLTKNEKLHGYEARLRCKDGSIKHVLISSSVLWENGRFVHTRCFTVDVSERKLAEEALRRTEKLAASGQLAASMAHEINNPLEAVMNLLFLAKSYQTEGQQYEFLSMAESELKRVAYISRRSLAFFKEGPERKNLELDRVVTDVVSIYQSRIQGRQIDVDCQLSPACVDGFEGELRQVISNLLLNAVDASKLGGKITIRVHRRGGKAVCLIADRGCGISAGDQRRIFQPFFTTKQETGTGLGLWLSKELVKSHGGSLRFKSWDSSRNAGTGTVFRFTVPAC